MANGLIGERAFLDLLTEIQNNSHTIVYTTNVKEDELINIDLNTRDINLKTSVYKDFIGIDKDHYAETLYFKVPRYYDDVDLMRMALVVEYVNAKGDSYLAPILVRDISSCPGYIIFGWNIHGNATLSSGTLTFAFRFFLTDASTHQLVYSLCTKPASGKIVASIAGKNADAEPGLINSYSLDDVISTINNKITSSWWTNL